VSLYSRPAWAQPPTERLDEVLEPVRSAHGVPALAGAVVRGSDLVALGAVGVRVMGMPERVQPADRFHLGSCTKSMTATLAAMLVEQSKLSWEATVGEVFPDLLGRIHASYHRVTLLQLLSHRSGLPEDRTPDPAIWPRVRALAGPIREQRRALIEIVLGRPPVAEAGTRMLYSNYGYTIAGAFAEHVTGQDWESLMRQMLFQPLGMISAGFGPPGPAQPWGHTPSGCQPVTPGPGADNPLVIGPAGTVHCSMSDWARYAALHLRGAQGQADLLVGPEGFQQLHRDRYQQGYALGWGVVQRSWAGGTALTHTGSNTLWYATIWLAPARNAVLLAATNCGAQSGFQACDSAIGAMIRRYL
jgi:CubicO group peptidase (beta-lactamase class C family)